ncbi:rRNA maturation RNase YbeY [Arenibacterium halophilum]|uniref:Endoribonuclease YbeY n=1 Tax=Arenibacterium halophilum TaxID=2583821 RepID=A0ABY2XFA6_9RHOB|nr:rRNA maturation RNase YbeY [Arenibacterium halophilum]TMV15406.1 rRNA maturation RNase YbeY [Arenibacterium halophilum]
MTDVRVTDTRIESRQWNALALEPLVEAAGQAVLAHLGIAPEGCVIAVLATDDAEIARLNTEFRGKPVPTNVLSWPAQDLAAEDDGDTPDLPEPDPTGETELGDIALAWDTCAREAQEAGKSVADHVTHLTVHGVLHLLGYDHIRDADATLMEGIETIILGRMGIADPYS